MRCYAMLMLCSFSRSFVRRWGPSQQVSQNETRSFLENTIFCEMMRGPILKLLPGKRGLGSIQEYIRNCSQICCQIIKCGIRDTQKEVSGCKMNASWNFLTCPN